MPPKPEVPEPVKRTTSETIQSVWYVTRLAFKQQPWLVGLNGVSSLVTAVTPIVSAYLLGRLTTSLYESATNHTVPARTVFGLIIAIAVTELISSVINGYIRTMSSFLDDRMRLDMSQELVKKFARLDFAEYERKEALDKYDRATEFVGNVGWVFRRGMDSFSSLIAATSAALALASVSPYIALVLVLGMIPTLFLQTKLQKERHAYWRHNTAKRRVARLAEDRVGDPRSVKEVRILGLVQYLLKFSRKYKEEQLSEDRGFDIRQQRQQLAQDTLGTTVETASLLYIAARIIFNGLAVGQFVFFQQVMQQFTYRVSSLLFSFQGIAEDLNKSHDFYEFMTQPEKQTKGVVISPDHIPTIEFDHVWFKYPESETYVLKDVSLRIDPGQKVALVGENGAGKSTLIKLMLGFYVPEKGEVRIDGHSTADIDSDSWFHHLGILFQEFERFPFTTLRENVQYGRVDRKKEGDAAVEEALDLAKVDFVDKLPHGLDTYLSMHIDEKNGTDLSGGQWQRVALARSFYRNPDVLILDEPTSAIDAKAEFEIFENVMRVSEGHTAVIVSHRFSTVRKADYIYVLEHGKLIEQGLHHELLERNGMYKELFEKQAAGYR
jgi:ATP-binding cassette subfamily B protein/ATP-binding cassette subfamily C protein